MKNQTSATWKLMPSPGTYFVVKRSDSEGLIKRFCFPKNDESKQEAEELTEYLNEQDAIISKLKGIFK